VTETPVHDEDMDTGSAKEAETEMESEEDDASDVPPAPISYDLLESLVEKATTKAVAKTEERMERKFADERKEWKEKVYAMETKQREMEAALAKRAHPARIGEAFLAVPRDIKAKILAGTFIDYATLYSPSDAKALDTHTLVIQDGEERVLKSASSKREIPSFAAWLEVHTTVTAVLLSSQSTSRTQVRAMLHHQGIIQARSQQYPWRAVYEYDQLKRKLVETAPHKYAILMEYNMEEE
jgi:hypothetical protein